MRAWTPAILLSFVAGGCGLFEELQSVEDASAGADTAGSESTASSDDGDSGSETAGAACEIVTDDLCEDQDTLQTCNPETGELTVYACGELCGTNINFTCLLAASNGQHGCWCVEPGIDAMPCTELEACLQQCVGTPGEACSDQCFSRATAGTIRTYGALVHCANAECAPLCQSMPEACSGCIQGTIAQGTGDCAVPRSLCDADVIEEPW